MHEPSRVSSAVRRAGQGVLRFQGIFFGLALVLIFGYGILLRPPSTFPVGTTITIPSGATLSSIAADFEAKQVVRYGAVLRLTALFLGGEKSVNAGSYRFYSPKNALSVSYAIMTGRFGIAYLRVVVPEGATNQSIADLLPQIKFSSFDREAFLTQTKPLEGYLFPDTYFFPTTVTAGEVIAAMQRNFLVKITELDGEIQSSGRSLSELIIMASLLEKEARTPQVRRTIAGILWKRLAIGMPLQVDAVFGYIRGRPTYSPPIADLSIESPYNTYRYKGLPPGAIGNPGLEAIRAAATPIETIYLYYLSDHSGVMHYGATLEEHKRNRAKYL